MEKNIPKRRFKEFIGSGEWEEKKLGEVADRFDNLRIPIAESKRIEGITPYYGANGIVDYVDGYTHNGEFVLLAEDGANDLNNYPIHYVNGKAWVNNHAHVIQGINNILENVFLVYCLKTIDISPYLVGGSRAKLNTDTMMKLNILIPSQQEQEKIGKFFEKLDRIIDLNREKLEKLKNIKSAYLSEMFPKEGELYPKRRFAGFTKPWEEKKLGDVVDVNSGKDYKHLSIGDIPVYGTGGYMLSVNKALSYDDAIGIGRKGTIDKPYILKSPFWTVDTLFYVTLKKNNNLNFIFGLFQKIDWKSMDESSGVPSLSRININNVTIKLASLEEQEKIGNFFKILDERIILQEEKIEKLENMKRAYLSEMFV